MQTIFRRFAVMAAMAAGSFLAVLPPAASAPSADPLAGLGARVCALYPWQGSTMAHIGRGCSWTVSEGRKLDRSERLQLSVSLSPPPESLAAYRRYHDNYMDEMKRYFPSVMVEPRAICAQGRPTGRKMQWRRDDGHTQVIGYAECDGHYVSMDIILKQGAGADPSLLFDELMARAIPLLSRR